LWGTGGAGKGGGVGGRGGKAGGAPENRKEESIKSADVPDTNLSRGGRSGGVYNVNGW